MTNLPDLGAKPGRLDDLNGRVHVHGEVMLAESWAGATPSERHVRSQRSLAGGLTLYADPITTRSLSIHTTTEPRPKHYQKSA